MAREFAASFLNAVVALTIVGALMCAIATTIWPDQIHRFAKGSFQHAGHVDVHVDKVKL